MMGASFGSDSSGGAVTAVTAVTGVGDAVTAGGGRLS